MKRYMLFAGDKYGTNGLLSLRGDYDTRKECIAVINDLMKWYSSRGDNYLAWAHILDTETKDKTFLNLEGLSYLEYVDLND